LNSAKRHLNLGLTELLSKPLDFERASLIYSPVFARLSQGITGISGCAQELKVNAGALTLPPRRIVFSFLKAYYIQNE
jgi:hypothetical protein